MKLSGLITLLVFGIIPFRALAQTEPAASPAATDERALMKGFVVYTEFLGAAKAVSINVEKPLLPVLNKWYCSGAIGFAALNVRGPFRSVPVGLLLHSAKGNVRKEIGLHVGYVQAMQSMRPEGYYSQSIYLTPVMGFRYQKPEGGVFFKLDYAPYVKIKEYSDVYLFRDIGKFRNYFGVSAGWYFHHGM